ncbi:MAG: hypothetical protein OCD03_02120 [Hyphomicrobiales bacterium]
MSINRNMRHLYLRGKTWWYYRRVPAKVAATLGEKYRQRFSLKTNILKFAQRKRDLIETSQNEYWSDSAISKKEGSVQNKLHYSKLIELIITESTQLEPPNETTFGQKINDLTRRIEALERQRLIIK